MRVSSVHKSESGASPPSSSWVVGGWSVEEDETELIANAGTREIYTASVPVRSFKLPKREGESAEPMSPSLLICYREFNDGKCWTGAILSRFRPDAGPPTPHTYTFIRLASSLARGPRLVLRASSSEERLSGPRSRGSRSALRARCLLLRLSVRSAPFLDQISFRAFTLRDFFFPPFSTLYEPRIIHACSQHR